MNGIKMFYYLESIKIRFFSFYDKKGKIPVIKKYQNIMNYLNNGLEMCTYIQNIRLKGIMDFLVHNLAD